MKNQSTDKSRRAVLKGIVSIPVVALAGFQTSAQAALVTPDNPIAVALGYVEKSTVADQTCANCSLYQGGTAAVGPCPIFPGLDVAAEAWCKSWVAKP